MKCADFLNSTDSDMYGPDTELARVTIMDWLNADNVYRGLSLKHLRIHTLPPIPDIVTDLSIGGSHLVYIPKEALPLNLAHFRCTHSGNVRKIPQLPNGVKTVSFAHSAIIKLPVLPVTIRRINAVMTNIKELPYLYTGIEEINIAGTYVSELRCKTLPDSLTSLDIAGTKIVKLPPLGNNITYLNISGTAIEIIPELPNSLNVMWAYNCDKLLIPIPNHYSLANGLAGPDLWAYGYEWRAWHETENSKQRQVNRSILIKHDLVMCVFSKKMDDCLT